MPPRVVDVHPSPYPEAEKCLELCKAYYNFITFARQNLEEEFNDHGATNEFVRVYSQICDACRKFLDVKYDYVKECVMCKISIDENIGYCERIVGFIMTEMEILNKNKDITKMSQCTDMCRKFYEDNDADPGVIQAYIDFINGN